MIGERFGKWLVTEESGPNKHGKKLFTCQCDCGKVYIIVGSKLRAGLSTQCRICSTKINGRKGLDAQCKPNLYIVSCGEYIKIGSTDNVVRRVNTMMVGNPYPIHIEYHGVGLGHLEPKLHTLYAEYHHKGEWFNLAANEIISSMAFISLTSNKPVKPCQ